mmetsp:Transcript_12667/g.15992  ORF Transcript_12667/g.15992 Transcript_12667/m.15992 type:complete len:172 (-) Transcript_12667:275-790(-)
MTKVMISVNRGGQRSTTPIPNPCNSCGVSIAEEIRRPRLSTLPTETNEWLCQKCGMFQINEIMNKTGRPSHLLEELETSARLSVFDKFLFLAENVPVATEGGDNQIIKTNPASSAGTDENVAYPWEIGTAYLSRTGMPGDTNEKNELERRLSVFDDFFFLTPDVSEEERSS